MKSRVKITAPMKIICYKLELSYKETLESIASSLGAEINFIDESSSNEQIGFLVGFKGFEKSNEICSEPPKEQCVIFSGFSSQKMDMMLLKFKENKINIPLKCVVTPFNQSWKLNFLVEELKKENKVIND